MSNQSVVIKSNKYGLIVVLDEKTEWEELKKNVAEKFRTSAKFFGSAQQDIGQILRQRPDGPVFSGKKADL